MVDLRTDIAGVRLRNPTMLASGFLDETGGSMARVYGAGASDRSLAKVIRTRRSSSSMPAC